MNETKVAGQLVILRGSATPPKISQYADEKALQELQKDLKVAQETI